MKILHLAIVLFSFVVIFGYGIMVYKEMTLTINHFLGIVLFSNLFTISSIFLIGDKK